MRVYSAISLSQVARMVDLLPEEVRALAHDEDLFRMTIGEMLYFSPAALPLIRAAAPRYRRPKVVLRIMAGRGPLAAAGGVR